jgi:hypothetical protein
MECEIGIKCASKVRKSAPKNDDMSLILLRIRAKMMVPPRFFPPFGWFSSPKAEFMPGSIPDFAIAFSQNGQAADEKGILKRRFVWLLVVVWARIEKEAKCLKSR